MQLQPLFDRVIVEKIYEDDVSPGGLFIPDQAKEKPTRGRVIAAGEDCKQLKADDVILFGRYAGSMVTINRQELLLLKEEDVFARITE